MRNILERLRQVFRDANQIAFSSAVFRITGKKFDSFTKQAEFQLKAKRMSSAIFVSTKEIVSNERYLTGLSERDRNTVFTQYRFELQQPSAILESISIIPESNKHKFKIFLLDENKMISMSTQEILNNDNLLSMLSQHDVVRITKASMLEKLSDSTLN